MARNTLVMVDVDSTLYDGNLAFQAGAKKFGYDWPVSPDWWLKARDIGCSGRILTQIFDHVHSHEIVQELIPYDGCRDALKLIQDKHPVDYWYVSNRSSEKSEPLRIWLHKYGFPQPDHVYVDKDKRDWILRYKPDFVIDDRIRTLFFAKTQVNSICMSILQPWNINLRNEEIEGIYIFEDWKDLSQGLDISLEEWNDDQAKNRHLLS